MHPPDLIYGTAFAFEKSALSTEEALNLGFRAIDTAGTLGVYQEDLVGSGIKASSIPREELYIQTKFSPYKPGKDPGLYPYDVKADIATQVEESIRSSLQNLRTTYIDCLVLHSVTKDTPEIWREMKKFTPYPIMSLGMSNTDLETLKMVCQIAKPISVQNRLTQDTEVNPESPPGVHYPDSPYDRDVRNYCQANGIKYTPWGVLWSNPQLLKEIPETGLSKEIILYACLRSLGATVLSGTKQIMRMNETIAGLNRMEVYAQKHPIEWNTHVENTKKILGWT